MRGQEEIVQFTKRNQPDESLRSVFGQHDLLSIGHNVDLELTLLFPLGPVTWSLSTPDRISTKTDKSKLLHGLQSQIEPRLDWPVLHITFSARTYVVFLGPVGFF